MCGEAGVCNVRHLFSHRLRGLAPYTVACNSFFQGLAADGAKAALFEVAKRQYGDPASPLFGTRTVNFIHDELLVEVPEDWAHEAAMELQRVMIDAFNGWVPDVPVRAGVSLMRRWSKNAEPLWEGGRLVPWENREAAA
jgi:DNA polymerase I-like protein with 3'-5' exonuclease and polymerase domains